MKTSVVLNGTEIAVLHTEIGINKAINSLESFGEITQYRCTNWKMFDDKRIETFLMFSNELDLIGTVVAVTDFTIEDDVKVKVKFYSSNEVCLK